MLLNKSVELSEMRAVNIKDFSNMEVIGNFSKAFLMEW
jgi:hypothetical protein